MSTKREKELSHIKFIEQIPQYTQKSEEWLNQRKNKLTSSDAATALGINPYKKPVELLLEKCGAGRSFFGNESTAHGEKYEDEAISKYEFLMGKKNYNFGMISYSDINPIRTCSRHKHEDYDFLGGSPDGIAIDVDDFEKMTLIEVKCPLRRKIKHGQIPSYYLPQVQLNMYILDLEIADFIEYIPGVYPGTNKEINIVRIQRDHEWFIKNGPKLKEFWNSVLEWRQKDITTHPEYSKYYPKPVKIYKKLFIETDEDIPSSYHSSNLQSLHTD